MLTKDRQKEKDEDDDPEISKAHGSQISEDQQISKMKMTKR
jgi:hypothetical protein